MKNKLENNVEINYRGPNGESYCRDICLEGHRGLINTSSKIRSVQTKI
jgi:hypothetical protein